MSCSSVFRRVGSSSLRRLVGWAPPQWGGSWRGCTCDVAADTCHDVADRYHLRRGDRYWAPGSGIALQCFLAPRRLTETKSVATEIPTDLPIKWPLQTELLPCRCKESEGDHEKNCLFSPRRKPQEGCLEPIQVERTSRKRKRKRVGN